MCRDCAWVDASIRSAATHEYATLRAELATLRAERDSLRALYLEAQAYVPDYFVKKWNLTAERASEVEDHLVTMTGSFQRSYADAESRQEQLAAANARVAELEARAEELTDALHRDRTGLAAALGRVVDSVKGRMWVTEGRGAYEWDDDRYKEEAGEALREAMGIAIQALRDSGTIANKALNGKEPKPEGERDRAYIVTLTDERDAATQRADAAERKLAALIDATAALVEAAEDVNNYVDDRHERKRLRETVANTEAALAAAKSGGG